MPTFTPYYNLALYDSTTDQAETFASYRAALNGVSTSNMTKIDNGIFGVQVGLNKKPAGSFYIPAIHAGSNAYTYGGAYGFESYIAGMTIVMSVDTDNTGSPTLNVNALGVRNLKKNQADGIPINLETGDLIQDKIYGFVYTESAYWLLITSKADIPVASDTIQGAVELAIISEVNTGTDATRAITPDSLAGSNYGTRIVQLQVTDPNGDVLIVSDGLAYFRVPEYLNGFNLVSVASHVTTVSTSGLPTIQIYNNTDSQDMLSTPITIDVNEKDSSTATTPAVINTTYDDVATADEIRIDCDVAGSGTKGLIVELGFRLP